MSSSKSISSCSEDDNELRRGPWTLEEDTMLTQYIANQGEGRWNLLAKRSGLKRTGKSCRLRWLNYLKPDVKRGNLTPQEQLLILELHSKWGNRWSKIAQHLPGRTDNEIKNYWRTRIQKQARHLKIETDSTEFQELVRRFWIPRLVQKVKESTSVTSSSAMSIQIHADVVPLPHDSVSQYYYSDDGKISAPTPWHEPRVQQQQQAAGPNYEQNSDSEQNNGSCISFSDPKVPQLLGYTTNEFNGLDANNDFGSFTYDGYNGNNNAYEIGTFNMAATTTRACAAAAAGDVEYPIGDCQMAESNRVNNDFACGMWNMDELWQFSSFQK